MHPSVCAVDGNDNVVVDIVCAIVGEVLVFGVVGGAICVCWCAGDRWILKVKDGDEYE